MGNNHTKPTFRYHNDGHVSDVHESFSRNFPNWYLDDDITVPKVFASLLDVALKNSLQHQFFWRDDINRCSAFFSLFF